MVMVTVGSNVVGIGVTSVGGTVGGSVVGSRVMRVGGAVGGSVVGSRVMRVGGAVVGSGVTSPTIWLAVTMQHPKVQSARMTRTAKRAFLTISLPVVVDQEYTLFIGYDFVGEDGHPA
jgi:hypothetical protein